MQNLTVFTDDLLSFELLFLLKISRANHISFDLSLSQHPIKHSFAYQGMNNSNKRGELKCRILWIHLPSISSQEEKHIMSLSTCQVSPNCTLTAKHQAIPIIAWSGCYTLEINLKKSLMHWLWGSTPGNGDVRRWCWGHSSPSSVYPWPNMVFTCRVIWVSLRMQKRERCTQYLSSVAEMSHSSWSHPWSLRMAEQKNRHCYCIKLVNGMQEKWGHCSRTWISKYDPTLIESWSYFCWKGHLEVICSDYLLKTGLAFMLLTQTYRSKGVQPVIKDNMLFRTLETSSDTLSAPEHTEVVWVPDEEPERDKGPMKCSSCCIALTEPSHWDKTLKNWVHLSFFHQVRQSKPSPMFMSPVCSEHA